MAVRSASKTRTIKQKVTISAPPAKVYEALVNARKHSAFTGGAATGAARVGARFTAWDRYISGKHLALDKGRRILQEWKTTEWPKGAEPSLLEITLAPKGKGTLLTMVHSAVPAAQAASLKDGWVEYYWKPLKAYFRRR